MASMPAFKYAVNLNYLSTKPQFHPPTNEMKIYNIISMKLFKFVLIKGVLDKELLHVLNSLEVHALVTTNVINY